VVQHVGEYYDVNSGFLQLIHWQEARPVVDCLAQLVSLELGLEPLDLPLKPLIQGHWDQQGSKTAAH